MWRICRQLPRTVHSKTIINRRLIEIYRLLLLPLAGNKNHETLKNELLSIPTDADLLELIRAYFYKVSWFLANVRYMLSPVRLSVVCHL